MSWTLFQAFGNNVMDNSGQSVCQREFKSFVYDSEEFLFVFCKPINLSWVNMSLAFCNCEKCNSQILQCFAKKRLDMQNPIRDFVMQLIH